MTLTRTVVVAALIAAARAAAAQTLPQSPPTITGVVRDTAGNVVDSAEVSIASLKRRVTAGPDGSFKFDNVKPGRYQVAARRIGFAPQVHTVTVSAQGGVVRFALVPTAHSLAPMISSAPLGGLSGVVGDTAYNVVQGAEISILATDHRTLSDSLGRFFIPLNAGHYVVRVERDGYLPRLASVTIPKDSGRKMVMWLEPGDAGKRHRQVMTFEALDERLVHKTNQAKLYTREDLNATSMTELSQLVTVGAGQPVDPNCMAIADDGTSRPVWNLSKDEIEFLELYPPKSLLMGAETALRTSAPTAASLGQNQLGPGYRKGSGYGCNVQIYVWLRK